MPCSICQHPQRQEIDQALIARSATLAALSQEHGLSTSALHRHKAHVQAKVHRAKDRLRDIVHQSALFWLSQALDLTRDIAQAARAEGNVKVALQAVSQGTRLLNIMRKQDFPLDDSLTYAILTSPEWLSQDSLLPHDPKLMSLSRQSLAGDFASPCPETEAAPASSLSQAELESAQPLSPSPAPTAQKANRKPAAGNEKLAGKSGKLPGYAECFIDEVEEYRLNELEKKIAQLDLDALTLGLPPAAANDKLEAIFDELYNSIPIPKDKPLSEYLHEQGLQADQEKHQGQVLAAAPGPGQGSGSQASALRH
jgi:hypothetical protein